MESIFSSSLESAIPEAAMGTRFERNGGGEEDVEESKRRKEDENDGVVAVFVKFGNPLRSMWIMSSFAFWSG